MNVQDLLSQIKENPENIVFTDVMSAIDAAYNFTETHFENGTQINKAGENSGSCKVFSFAQLHNLDQEQTLALFGQYYQDVLNTPEASDHQNIRQFMQNGFDGLHFSGAALSEK